MALTLPPENLHHVSPRNFYPNILENLGKPCEVRSAEKPTLNKLSAVNGRSVAEGGENGGD